MGYHQGGKGTETHGGEASRRMENKGMSVIPTLAFVRERFGEKGYKEWLASLSPSSRALLTGNILPSVWYPLEDVLVGPTQKICELFFKGDAHGAWEVGRFSADYALQGIYRFFVRIGSPGWLVKKATKILPSYYRPVRGVMIDSSTNVARFRIYELAETSGMAEQRIAGWIERGVEISGAKGNNVTILASLADGSKFSEIEVAWE
jgi:hypothetical protein